jgi:A/G-specific adenine glycosylase
VKAICQETTRDASPLFPSLSQFGAAASSTDLALFRRALLRWYDRNRRALPWRETRDPYRIWISEIMLQQTRVAAVLDHYRIFLDRFPNVRRLAAASEDAVLAAWSGLGYYRRARSLHRCAQDLMQKHKGRFPAKAADLLALPGIGRYTAAAIASIAFDEPVAVVDGNVERVLRRLMGTDFTEPDLTEPDLAGLGLTAPQTWQHAQALLDNSRPGDFNQAMMELGAIVCVPGEPRCPTCPVRKWCTSRQSGKGANRSLSSKRRASGKTPFPVPQIKKNIWCLLMQRGDGIRLVQRSRTAALMPGMWELPQTSGAPRPGHAEPWRTFRHSITVTDYTVHVLRSAAWRRGLARSQRRAASLLPKAAQGEWIAIDRIAEMPITGLTRKILKAGGII